MRMLLFCLLFAVMICLPFVQRNSVDASAGVGFDLQMSATLPSLGDTALHTPAPPVVAKTAREIAKDYLHKVNEQRNDLLQDFKIDGISDDNENMIIAKCGHGRGGRQGILHRLRERRGRSC